MKTTRTFYSIVIMITLLLFVGCEKGDGRIYEKSQFIGEWRAYEHVVDGEVFTQFTLFNTYYTGIDFVDLEEARYLLIYESGEIGGKSNNFTWGLEFKELILYGEDMSIDKELKVEKLSESELWLSYTENNKSHLLKFKRI